MATLSSIFSNSNQITLFDPSKSKVEIILDARSLLFPTDPAQYNNDHNGDGNNNSGHNDNNTQSSGFFSIFSGDDNNSSNDSDDSSAIPEIKNQAKDKPLKCRDMSLQSGTTGGDNDEHHNNGFTYPFQGQCLNAIDKLALNIQAVELVMVPEGYDDHGDSNYENNSESGNQSQSSHSAKTAFSKSDSNGGLDNDTDDQPDYTVVSTIYNESAKLFNLNSDGLLITEALIDPVSFNGIKFTFTDGSQLVYKNGTQRTSKALKLKDLDQPAVTDDINLQASYVTSIHLALDNAKMSFGATETQNRLTGSLRFRSIDSYVGAYAVVQNYENPDGGDSAPRVSLPLTVDQTATEFQRQLTLMPGRTYIAEDAVNPKMYHDMIYINSPRQRSVLKVLGITYDYFPLWGNNTGATQPGGIIDMSRHLQGFFVYALISDFQYNLMLCFHLFSAFDVLEEVSYETLAYAGYHNSDHLTEPSELEFADAEEIFQVAINNGVVFPTATTAIGTLNVGLRFQFNFWSAISRGLNQIARVISDVVRTLITVVVQGVSLIAVGIGILVNPKGEIRGGLYFKNPDGTVYTKEGNRQALRGTRVVIRQNGFELNGVEIRTNSTGVFTSGPLAYSVDNTVLHYKIRVELENDEIRVHNANPLWPVVIDLGANLDVDEYPLDEPMQDIYLNVDSNIFVYGVANFAAKRSQEIFEFQPDKVVIITEGVVNDALSSFGTAAITPAGHLAEASYLLSLVASALDPLMAALNFSLAAVANFAFQLDGDIYLGPDVLFSESTIVHEYGHFIMFNKIDQRFLVSPVTGILLNYLNYFDNPTYPDLGPNGVQPNGIRFLEAWAEFFAYNALSTKNTAGVYDIPVENNRITGSYFTIPTEIVDSQVGLEINFGSAVQYGNPVLPFDKKQNAIGRDASIFQDLFDNTSDTDITSGQSDGVSLGKNILQAIVNTAPAVCTLNLFAGTTDPCQFNVASLYNSFLNHTTFAQLANIINGTPDTSLMNVYQMHGFLFPSNDPYSPITTYDPATNTFQMQTFSSSSSIVLIGSDSTSLTWAAGVSGNYEVHISNNCLNGPISSGANGQGFYNANQTVVSIISVNDLQAGANNVTICLQNGSLIEQLSYIVYRDLTPPTVSATPAGGAFANTLDVSILCNDTGGSGCSNIVFTKNGETPSWSPRVGTTVNGSLANVTVQCNEDLQFIAVDSSGNVSPVSTETYSNGVACCTTQTTCDPDTTSCVYQTHDVENAECWNDFFDLHYCICGSQAIWPWSEKPCYITVNDPPVCTTTPGTCTSNLVCNY